MRKIEDMAIRKGMSIYELVEQMERGCAFSSKNLATGAKILRKMFADKNCKIFFSFPAAIVSTGLRGLIKDAVKAKFFDVIITTCGTLDHDIARSSEPYYHGAFELDDALLHKKKINRLGNVAIPYKSYGAVIERKLKKILTELYKDGKKNIGTRELAWEIGKKMDKSSILYWCWKNEVPLYVPGITDGAVGSQIWLFSQEHRDFSINSLKDENELADIVFNAKKTGALMIGGGISKHHTIWWNQFKGGLDYAVYITTAHEFDGSLSGARLREAISWGKLKENARQVTIDGDATVILPIIFCSIVERNDWVRK
ncbi:MAG: deoxyhypusine synthase [Candidatus Thermoplasmatota archaeon]